MALSIAALALTVLGASEPTADSVESPTLVTIFPAAVRAHFSTQESLYHVYRSPEDFAANWPRESSCDAACAHAIVAPIDFTQYMLVVIAPRGRGQQTYDVAATAVAESSETIDVTFLELRYGKSTGHLLCGVILTVPQPAISILVPRSDKEVRFFRRRADVLCEEPVQVQ
ncbi:MAG TPA: hypothetical protein VJL86_07600 [Steroidobacteraceae bacterium]|nr:hypothetical protein [Steroidobacteraceae bacterium]